MLESMWRLHPRGAANQGVCVDADGAMLGPDCALVERTSSGFRAASREPMRGMQCIAGLDKDDPDWLYQQSQRIADALDRGELALAQIYGLRIPVRDLGGRQLKQLAALAPLTKAGFDPDEPRLPVGQPGGGEWTTGGETEVAPAPELREVREPPPAAPPITGGRWPAPAGANLLFHPAQVEEDENARGGGLLGEFLDPLRELRQERYEWLRAQLRAVEPGNREFETLTAPDHSPTWADIDELDAALRDAQERRDEPKATAWERGWGARGVEAEVWRLGGKRTLPSNTPTVDHFTVDGVAISVKSIDLKAPSYGDPLALSPRIDRYVDQLASFDGLNWGEFEIEKDEIRGRVLDIVIPKNSGTASQQQAITRSIDRAERLHIHVLISRY